MPDFTFTSPDNKQYTVSGPNGATKEQAFQILQSHLGASNEQPSVLADMGKQALVGPAVGVADTFGQAGDLRNAISSGVSYLGDKAGISPDKVRQFKNLTSIGASALPFGSNIVNAPTSSQLRSGIESVTGQLPDAQTVPGQYMRTAGEFLPALVGGEESLIPKLAKRVIAPALTSETAGQLTQGTALEPYARLLGGVTGGLAAAKVGGAPKAVVPPTADELLSTAGNQFDAARNSGLTITPDAAETISNKIKSNLLNQGYHPDSQPQVFNALDRLAGYGIDDTGALKPVTTNEMESIRKALVNSKMNPDGSVRSAAKMATDQLLKEQGALTPTQVLSGNAADYNETLNNAIGNYAAGKRSNTVMGKAALGQLNADTAGSGGNLDNASRQAIKQLVRPINNDIVPQAKRLGFNDAEIAQMNQAARGTVTGNIARYLGKAAPTGIVSLAGGAGGGFAVGGPMGAVAAPVAGYVAKKIGDLSTKRAIAALDSLVRSRSPLATDVAARLPIVTKQLSAPTAALLSGMMASSSLRQPVSTLQQQ